MNARGGSERMVTWREERGGVRGKVGGCICGGVGDGIWGECIGGGVWGVDVRCNGGGVGVEGV